MSCDWRRHGLVLARAASGEGSDIVGDPCVVWDEQAHAWRAFLFLSPPGHGQAISTGADILDARWQLLGPLRFVNPHAILGGSTHKPWVVMDPHRPNVPARVKDRYCLLTVSYGSGKIVQRAWSTSLAGPWTLETEPLIDLGGPGEFDGKHVDAISGYYFDQRQEFLYFYMGYPRQAQARELSPYGSAQAVATQRLGERRAVKRGVILPPDTRRGHWASGWVGGLQLLPGRSHRWIGLLGASPTPPSPADASISREEPPPSLGGFAFSDEEWPVGGWEFFPDPIEWIDDIPEAARLSGESTNFWRQHAVVPRRGRVALLYNSGAYGQEQIYMKSTDALP